MPQAGFTPIQTYNSPTAGHIPVYTDLYAGELAINTTDEKLYFKNTGGTVKLLASTAVFTTTGLGSYVLATSPTITGHPTIEGVTSTGATGTGKFVFDSAPTITGHPTIEGVTSTGATGTGKFVFDSAPTITGHPTIEGVTSTGATGTGKFVFDSAPTITGHPTIEGVTSTGATGTGKFVFDSSPTLSGVTLSDGTANGVTYLNSSKVLTSGNGLVYDGTNLGVMGSSTFYGYSRLTLQSVAASTITSKTKALALKGITGVGNYTGTNYYTDAINETLYTPNAFFGVVSTSTAGAELCDFSWGIRTTTGSSDLISEQMRLTRTGLGIGTSSPSSRLTIKNSTGNGTLSIETGTTTTDSVRLAGGGSTTNWLEYCGYLGHVWFNNATEYMRLDSSGNLGLGVVPSGWSQGKAFEMYASGYGLWNGSGSPSSIYVLANAYYNGGFKYGSTAAATHYYQYQGAHVWSTAPSGTAGNAISFTQAMTLDASGRFIVGATGTAYSAITSQALTSGISYWSINDATLNYSQIYFGSTIESAYTYVRGDGRSGGYLAFGTADIERLRIDSSGNLLVGTTSGSYKITCNGQPGANGYTAWTNYSDERLKENIVDFVSEPVLNKICELRPVSFNYNDKTGFDEETRKRTVSGFIAQEMQQVFPDMVGKTIIGEEEYLDTNLSNLTLYLVKAIQELTARIEKLENKL